MVLGEIKDTGAIIKDHGKPHYEKCMTKYFISDIRVMEDLQM